MTTDSFWRGLNLFEVHMKKIWCISILILLMLSLLFLGCTQQSNKTEYPKLKVVNNNPTYSVLQVKLVGYEFNDLNIEKGTSKTFELNNGISGGYENVNVTVIYGLPQMAQWRVSKNCNFFDGQTTTVTVGNGVLE